MISFPCKCGQILQVPDDQAGLTAQCPHCGLLRDVPTLSDLSHIKPDGTYELEPTIELAEQDRVEQVRRAFSKRTLDYEGEEIDLRPTMSEVKQAGYVEEAQDDAAPLLPKYDPITGELVEPIRVKEELPASNQIPLAKRALGYAPPDRQSVHYSGVKIFLELLQPANVVVMCFVLFAHAIFEGLFLLVRIPYFFMLAPLFFGVIVMIFAHYSIVVEEIAVEERDELPRPLRQFEFLPDVFWPFIHAMAALFFAFAPATYAAEALRHSRWQYPAYLGLTVLGFVFFPALLLTLNTSGTIRNIRPDRLVGVMIQAGSKYVLAVVEFPVILGVYYWGILGVDEVCRRVAKLAPPQHDWMSAPVLVFPLLIIGVYMMHYFCWYLGLIYRDHHDEFPWVLQRHIPTRLLERTRT